MSDKKTVIASKITGFSVRSSKDAELAAATPAANEPSHQKMNELIARDESLSGRTYKIAKSPASEHAIYVTINDIVLNEGTEFESRQPFEIFINSKNMDQFQWIVAMTRIMSAVFRKGGDVTFLVEEMKSVFDPHGGYYRKGGLYVPSLVAEIGLTVETHLKSIGLIKSNDLSPEQFALIEEKRKKLMEVSSDSSSKKDEAPSFPASSTMCSKCNTKAMIILDGCQTCLNCGNSKCG